MLDIPEVLIAIASLYRNEESIGIVVFYLSDGLINETDLKMWLKLQMPDCMLTIQLLPIDQLCDLKNDFFDPARLLKEFINEEI